jgi:hypothetical protein
MFDADTAEKLLRFFVPFFTAWFVIGITITVLYHLSLYYLDGEFRARGDESMDVFVSVLRAVVYIFAWPAVFYFDRSALYRIKMLFRYMDPRLRIEDDELAGYIAEGRRRKKLRQDTMAWAEREQRRAHEQTTGEERAKYTRTFHEGNPELDRIWMMMAVGSGPGGGRELVRIYQVRDLADEVLAKARVEIGCRYVKPCEHCGEAVQARKVELPELLYVNLLEEKTNKPLIDGWGLRGTCSVEFQNCPDCDAEKAGIVVDVASFGTASGVIKDLRTGVSIHEDLPT